MSLTSFVSMTSLLLRIFYHKLEKHFISFLSNLLAAIHDYDIVSENFLLSWFTWEWHKILYMLGSGIMTVLGWDKNWDTIQPQWSTCLSPGCSVSDPTLLTCLAGQQKIAQLLESLPHLWEIHMLFLVPVFILL